MTRDLDQFGSFVGVDVSEAQLDVHLLPSGDRASFSRPATAQGRKSAFKRDPPQKSGHPKIRAQTCHYSA